MIDGIDLTKLTSNIIEELVDRWICIDPDSHLIFLSQETAFRINVSLAESFVDSFMAIEKCLKDIEYFFSG